MKLLLSANRLILPLAGAIYLCLTWQNMGRSLPTQSSPTFEIASPDSPINNWYEYTAPDGSYSIKFPGKPEEQNLQIPSGLGQLSSVVPVYQDLQGQRAFFCSSIKYPIDSALYDVEKGLNGGIDMVVRMLNATIISDENISLQGMEGKEVILESPEGYKMVLQIFIDSKGPTLYQVWVAGTDEILNNSEIESFFDSFTLLK